MAPRVLIVGVILAVAVIILAAQNTRTATISFLGWDLSTPLMVVILGSLLIGIVLVTPSTIASTSQPIQ